MKGKKVGNLQSFFAPKSVAIVGVSADAKKLGSVILQNIKDAGFAGQIWAINPKLADKTPEKNLKYAAEIADISEPIDLVIIAVPAQFCEQILYSCKKNRTKNVIIISAGFAEVGQKDLEQKVVEIAKKSKINLLGPNCLGAIFPHAGLNASFSAGFPEKGNVAFISQSGAFCSAVLDWAGAKNTGKNQAEKIGFSHFISLGNKAGISEIEILDELADDPKVELFAFYLESLKNGSKFLAQVKKISDKKPVIILEPGRSEAACQASSSHTGSLAPNAKILSAAIEKSGAIQVFSMRELFEMIELLSRPKNLGSRVAVLTNAGGVGVLASDLIENSGLELAKFSPKTLDRLRQNLPASASIKNPVDLIGDAGADRYLKALEAISDEKSVDQILVFLTPQRTTEIEKTAEILAKFSKKTSQNIVASFIGGAAVAKGREILDRFGVGECEFPVDLIPVLGRLAARQSRILAPKKSEKTIQKNKISKEKVEFLRQKINSLRQKNLKKLPENLTETLLDLYQILRPISQNFSPKNLAGAQKFFAQINPAVVKISADSALHKTDLKGVFLNVNAPKKLEKAFKNLAHSIEISEIKNAEIQLQQQVSGELEILAGLKRDPDFGSILVFGTGGIFTEIYDDAATEILPASGEDLLEMMRKTKAGKILEGVRNQVFAVESVQEILEKMQQMVFDFPEISAIDANPILVSEKAAIAVDFKVLIA